MNSFSSQDRCQIKKTVKRELSVDVFLQEHLASQKLLHVFSSRNMSISGSSSFTLELADFMTATASSSAIVGEKRDTIKMLHRPSLLPAAAESGKLQWRNINIFVGDKDDENQILHDISGEILSGELLALMGGSGAGIYVQNGYSMCSNFVRLHIASQL